MWSDDLLTWKKTSTSTDLEGDALPAVVQRCGCLRRAIQDKAWQYLGYEQTCFTGLLPQRTTQRDMDAAQ